MFEAAGIANAQTDAQTGQFLRVNKTFCDLVGYSAEELLQMTFLQLTHPDDRERNLLTRNQAMHSEPRTIGMEKRYVRKDGRVIWVHASTTLMRNDAGEAGTFLGSVFDITERKNAEQALMASEQRFRLAAAATHAMVFDLDVQSMRLNSMEGLQELLGCTIPSEQLTMDWWEERIEPDDRHVQRAAFASMRRHPQALSREYRMRHSDGRSIWVADHVTPVLDDAGNLLRIVGTVVDITKRKQAEQALQKADRSKDSFIATLAHELRNPLAPVANAAKVMKELTLTDPKLSWCRDVIERQVDQMTRLLDDLLDISRITSNKLTLRLEPVDLTMVIDHAIEMACPLIEAAGHSLNVTLPDDPVLLHGDRVRLSQILTNLLTNAAKYTPANGHIDVRAEEDAGSVRVQVSDNGIGLAAEDLQRVFNMFGQVQSALERSQGGLGIGLALVKGLIDLHGGSISAHSEGPGKGSRFVVCLPLFAQTPLAPIPPQEDRKPAAHRRILVVDDNRDNVDSLAILLQMSGHDVEKAHDGREAISKAEEHRPDVILLDIGLPRMNGYDACRAIRKNPWGKEITIVAITGWGQEEDRHRTHDAGFDAHLTKPIDYAALMNLLLPADLETVSAR